MSYAQVYFSNRLWLGAVLLAVSFFDVGTGCAGALAIVMAQVCSRVFGFDDASTFNGVYTYNALLTGLSLGSLYQWSLPFAAVLMIASLLALFLTVWISGRTAKRGLPFLTLPFLLTIWILLTGLNNFSGVKLSLKDTFSLHEWLPALFSSVSAFINASGRFDAVHHYLCSLSANIFQYNDLAGVIIAIALLLRSRMTFVLSIYGFGLGYAFYSLFEGDFTPLVYSYIGFNFILTAIALGGYFIVPSAKSYLLLLFVIPLTALLLSAMNTVFLRLHLPLYSLPFNAIVLLTIGALQMRHSTKGLELVTLQQYSPEDNHYKSYYYHKRFAGQLYYHLNLPFMGEWQVSQGYDGSITHRGEWQHALDFDVRDEQGATFGGTGFYLKDYYCYDLPVLAPAAGYVSTIRDGVRDNEIGEVNLEENWGNTIILKHADGLYTKLSHLKPGSFRVKEGMYVQAGELIAHCGSSGRSPEPHLHFQAQATPYIGSQTLSYPIAYYLSKVRALYAFHSFEVPALGETVRKIIPSALLVAAFDFQPGKEFLWLVEEHGKPPYKAHWKIEVDVHNRSYIHCRETGAAAYFYNDGTLLYFTDYYGARNGFLHLFYTAFQKILLGHYAGVVLDDWLLPQTFFSPLLMAVQDIAAPFFHFLQGRYHFGFEPQADSENILIATESYGVMGQKKVKGIKSKLQIGSAGIEVLELDMANRKIIARCAR